MFIAGEGIKIEDEALSVRTGILWYLAVHSDMRTLKDGVTFIIDQSAASKPVGNERKLQQTWSALPLRPKHFFIVGAPLWKRVFINTLLAFAKLFTSAKVLGRIQFCSVDDCVAAVEVEQLPEHFGGSNHGDQKAWALKRLSMSSGWFSETTRV